jgi:hypothetical protein
MRGLFERSLGTAPDRACPRRLKGTTTDRSVKFHC